ncbi:MAG TPA: tetratricopeptide repeat protein [Chloroflexota bacterium]|nr:tetratricopeptide repeat protein [Chloroflexota bacterium]
MAQLEIRLLGGFTLHADGDPVVRLPRQQALLAWLLLHPGQPQSRGRIASHFWPDASDPQGRSNLRKLLHDLRSAWPDVDDWIATDRDAIAWRTDRPYLLDVDQFLNLALPGRDPETIRAAVSAYTGDFLPDCYDEWILPFRVDLQRRFVGVLEQGMASAETARDYTRAIGYAERLLQEEPLREDAYASLMRIHASAGDRAGALRTYHACASVVEQELGVSPGPEIAEIYHQLLAPNRGAPASVRGPREPRHADFIGRASEWRALQAVWRSVLDGAPSIVVISGDPGVGKTRLAEEMQDWAERQGLAVHRAACHAGEEALPFSGITQLLARCPLSSLPVMHLRELARLLPRLLEDHPDVEEPGSIQEGWQRRLLLESITHALLAVQPVVLTVDDVQWCDVDSILALEHLLRFEPTSRCLLLATARVGAGQIPGALLRDAKLHSLVTEIDLAPLDREETMRLAETHDTGLSPSTLGPAEMDALYRETEGNPLFVVEVVRAGWKPGGDSSPPIPPSLQTSIRGRFAQLPEGARELLGVAATIGTAFRLPVLTHATNQGADDLVRNIDELWRQRIIREQGADGYEFTHGKLREVAYTDLSNAHRANLHGRVAQAYTALRLGPTDMSAADVARHLELAGRRSDAGGAYLEAAESALHVYANESAVSNYRHALGLIPASERPNVQLLLGAALLLTGDWKEAERVYREALHAAIAQSDPAVAIRCRIAIGDLYRISGRFAEGLEWLQTARGELEHAEPDHLDPAALARVTGLICEALLWLARYQEAEECARQQLSLAEEAGDMSEIAAATANLGTVYARRTQYDEALQYYRRNLELEEQRNDPSRLQEAMGRIGNLHRLRGEFQLAQRYLEQQLSMAQQIGNVHAEAMAASNLSNLWQEQGDFDVATMWLEKALTTYRRLGDRQREAASLGNLGVLLHDGGDLPQAWENIAKSIELQTHVGDRRNAAVALGSLGQVYSDVGGFQQAMDCLVASILISLDIDNPQNVTITAGAIGEAYLRQGRTSEAEMFTARAVSLARLLSMSHWLCLELLLHAQVREQAGKLDEAVPINGEAVALIARSPHRELQFQATLLQLRLRGKRDQSQSTAVVRDLHALAADHPTLEDSAAIQYEIWSVDPSQEEARQDAGRLYSRVYAHTPKFQYGQRLMELTGERPPAPPSLPNPPAIVREWQSDADQVLKRLDELYQRFDRGSG